MKVEYEFVPAQKWGGEGKIILGDTPEGFKRKLSKASRTGDYWTWERARKAKIREAKEAAERLRIEEIERKKETAEKVRQQRVVEEARVKQQKLERKEQLVRQEKRFGGGVVTVAEKPKGWIERKQEALRKLGKQEEIESLKGTSTVKGQVKGAAAGIGKSFLSSVLLYKQFYKEPLTTTKKVGVGIYETGKKVVKGEKFPEIGQMIKERPGYVTGYVATEVGQAVIGGKIIKKVGDITDVARTKLSPKYTKLEKVGKTEVLKVPSKLPGEVVDIKIAKSWKGIKEPISKQAKKAGKEVTAVSGAKDLFGKFTRKQIKIQKKIPKQTPKLEKAFFADPQARLRTSRLGLGDEIKPAGIVDILSGDVTLKKPKPQAILFEKTKLANLPKDIGEKLRVGKKLSPTEQARFTKWQLQPEGKFKPVGFISTEPEITLAPGEIIKKVDVPGVTIIKGKRVPIIRAEVIKSSPTTKKLLTKPKLSTTEVNQLTKRLVKETGLDVSKVMSSKKYISPASAAISVSPIVKGTYKIQRPISLIQPKRIKKPTSLIQPKRIKKPVSLISRGMKPTSYFSSKIKTPRISSPYIQKGFMREPPILSPSTKISPKILPVELIKSRKKFIPKKIQNLREDIARTAGYTARALGIKQKVTPEQLKRLITEPKTGVGIRPILIVGGIK